MLKTNMNQRWLEKVGTPIEGMLDIEKGLNDKRYALASCEDGDAVISIFEKGDDLPDNTSLYLVDRGEFHDTLGLESSVNAASTERFFSTDPTSFFHEESTKQREHA